MGLVVLRRRAVVRAVVVRVLVAVGALRAVVAVGAVLVAVGAVLVAGAVARDRVVARRGAAVGMDAGAMAAVAAHSRIARGPISSRT